MKILILLFTIFLIVIVIISIRKKNDEEFSIWYAEVLDLAPQYGFSEDEIEMMDEIDFYMYYNENMSPKEALKQEKNNYLF